MAGCAGLRGEGWLQSMARGVAMLREALASCVVQGVDPGCGAGHVGGCGAQAQGVVRGTAMVGGATAGCGLIVQTAALGCGA